MAKSNNPDGRPPKYDTPEEMQEVIDLFFSKCDEDKDPYTITGLALELGMSRQALCDYEKKGEFLDTIKKAKQKVESYAEKSLYRNNQVTGVIFNLKNNFGWVDKQEKELSGNLGISGVLDEIDGSSAGLPESEE